MTTPEPIYLNVCSDDLRRKGFINIGSDAGADVIVDLRNPLPFLPDSVQGIYCENFVERLDRAEILAFFRECRRILKSGGVVRVATPDLDAIIQAFHGETSRAAFFDSEDRPWTSNRAGFINGLYRDRGYRWLLNFEELTCISKETGFASTHLVADTESSDPRLGALQPSIKSPLIVEFIKKTEPIALEPLVSIVIPAYKPQFFRESLWSALNQTYRNIEILVLDDSPSDFIEDIAREMATQDARVTYIRNTPALGESANLSKGIALARGEFIKPLYDDDILLPEATETLLNLFRMLPDTRLAAGRRVFIDATGKVLDAQPTVSQLYENTGRICGPKAIAEIAAAGINMIGEPTVILFRKQDALSIDEPTVMSLFGEACIGLGDLAMFAHLLSMGDLAYTTDTISQFRIHADQTQRHDDTKKHYPTVWNYFRECILRLGLASPPAQVSSVHIPRAKPLSRLGDEAATKQEDGPQVVAKDISDRGAYNAWLHKRAPTARDKEVLVSFASRYLTEISFEFIVRLPAEQRSRLADTLDSLNCQLYANWHIHVITPMSAPDGIAGIPCLSWHCLPAGTEKPLIDALVDATSHPWVVEIPPGAVLDPQCLWRLANEIKRNPEGIAFFVDDDIYDRNGARKKPRFKPGVNPAWLYSSDLAGPLFVRRDVWQQAGGVSATDKSPWFDLLLRIIDRQGWANVHHVPDVLVSYPEQFPSDLESCLTALVTNLLTKGLPADLEPASKTSWRIRPSLPHPPRVSLVVLSNGQLDLLARCINSIIEKTAYPDYEIVLVVPDTSDDDELEAWLNECVTVTSGAIRVIRPTPDATFGKKCNLAATTCSGDSIVVMGEGCVAIDPKWLEQLVRASSQSGVAGVTPRLLIAGTATIDQAGAVLGLTGLVGYPYREAAELGDPGYLDWLQVPRDVTLLPDACFLVRADDFRELGGVDEEMTPPHATADMSLRLKSRGKRLLYEPTAAIVGYRYHQLEIANDPERQASLNVAEARSAKAFSSRWLARGKADPYWSVHLSLAESTPKIEPDYFAQWQFQPTAAPRIMARPVTNPQGEFRITAYLRALREAGKATECVWPQIGKREPTAAEIQRLGPDSLVIQHYILDHHLAALRSWYELPGRPFIAFAMDDLLTNLDASNPFRKGHPANNRSRLKFALERCDRLVASTDFLADCFSHLARDIRVVPNRLEMNTWLPLHSSKRTGARPRIGWAGGTTHLGDLGLLKEVIERTRHEADWVFFGMCPPEIRPLLAEYHELVAFADYPALLASLNFDIAVAPLAETPFNRAKSNLRLLEYGALGIPVVCTDIDPYQNSPACRVANTVDAWVKALRERIHDADAREREGQEMRRWVRHGYLLENHIDEWLSAHLP